MVGLLMVLLLVCSYLLGVGGKPVGECCWLQMKRCQSAQNCVTPFLPPLVPAGIAACVAEEEYCGTVYSVSNR